MTHKQEKVPLHYKTTSGNLAFIQGKVEGTIMAIATPGYVKKSLSRVLSEVAESLSEIRKEVYLLECRAKERRK